MLAQAQQVVTLEMTVMDLAKRDLIDMQAYAEYLHQHDHLIRVKSEVDADRELAGSARV